MTKLQLRVLIAKTLADTAIRHNLKYQILRGLLIALTGQDHGDMLGLQIRILRAAGIPFRVEGDGQISDCVFAGTAKEISSGVF